MRALHERCDIPRYFVAIFCAHFVGRGVAWFAVTCACSFVRLPILLLYVLHGSCCFLLLYCGCTILVCEVVLNYVEVGAITRCVVVSVVPWCSDALWCCVWDLAFCFDVIYLLCWCVVCLHDTWHALLFFCCVVLTQMRYVVSCGSFSCVVCRVGSCPIRVCCVVLCCAVSCAM